MIEIRTFRGFTYNLQKNPDLTPVICPPYDIINPEQRNALYGLSPDNFVRVDFNRPETSDTADANPYTRARDQWEKMSAGNILVQDTAPSIYLYQQEFSPPFSTKSIVRTSFIASLGLQPFEKQTVLPHEYTFSGPKEDRFKLMQACRAVTGQIMMLYPDSDERINKLLKIILETPFFAQGNMDGIVHRLWKVSDREWCRQLSESMAPKTLVIADGHHRYETALNYMAKQEAEGPAQKADASHRFIMMSFVRMEDPGLVVLPIHRVVGVSPGDDPAGVMEKIKVNFILEPAVEKSVEPVIRAMAMRGKQGPVFWMKCKTGEGFWLTLKKDVQLPLNGHSERWAGLDVSILQSLLIDRVFGITPDHMRKGERIRCIKDPGETLAFLEKEPNMDYAFFLNPLRISDIEDIVGRGERMPQKSTNFHPKIYSGLVAQAL